jgi:L-threonylcarbamoyladenylate synthase
MRVHPVIAQTLRRGGVGVMPTDTIYGIVGSALKRKTVERIYKLRKRNPKKPCIVLVGTTQHLRLFDIQLTTREKHLLKKLWPNAVSVILPLPAGRQGAPKFSYLHRGTKSLAFRLPKPQWLRELLKKTGPLVAPSANWEGEPPARTVREAKRYFGDGVDFYVDAGRKGLRASTLVRMTPAGRVVVLRPGAVRVP